MKISYTRAMIDALFSGALKDVPYEPDPVFGVMVPQSCPGVPADALKPRSTWLDLSAYDEQAHKLAKMFNDNFQQFSDAVPVEVLNTGPKQ
jgi:phosphoenolpyruvate carboxykinase (ATP)